MILLNTRPNEPRIKLLYSGAQSHKRLTTLSHPSVAIVTGRTPRREVEVTRYDAMMATLISGIMHHFASLAFIDAIPSVRTERRAIPVHVVTASDTPIALALICQHCFDL